MEVDPLNHPCKPMVRTRTALLLGFILFTLVVGSALPTLALEKHSGAALEWTMLEPLPNKVDVDEEFSLTVTVTNEGTVDLTGGNKTTVELTVKGDPLDTKEVQITKGQSTTIIFKITITSEGEHELKLNSYYRYGLVELYNDKGVKTSTLGTVRAEVVEEPINWTPIIAVIAVAALGIVGFILFDKRKKKAEEERRLAEEARRQDLIRKKEAEIAKKIEVRHIVGKHPRDYYLLRRMKYANLRPAGMTSSGLNILRRQKTKAELEAEKIVCPKCGTDLPEPGAVCPRCAASEKVESVRHTIRTYKSQADADFSDAEALLRKAEHRLNWSDFAMAAQLVDEAEQKMEEIWAATKMGETLTSTVEEYSESKGPSLDAKVIGLEGEEAAIPAAIVAAKLTSTRDKEPAGEPCPECGTPMDSGVCLFCTFEENLDSCWSIIEKAELDGADMKEMSDLCRQANNAKERGSDELAIRYLSRATRLSEEAYHEHARSKTEGIIRFTNALIMQVKSMGEEVTMAEQMITKAEEAMEAGEYETARSMAAKADGYLKQMKEDSYRKQIQELLPIVEAGSASNLEVQQLLFKAKKLINANELEGAVDLLETAKTKL